MADNNLILIGPMGVGKSTVGRLLRSTNLWSSFVDIDEKIVEAENLSITEIFEQKSEKYFRALESFFIKHYAQFSNQVIAIGGGAYEDDENRSILRNAGKVVYLFADIDSLLSRINNDGSRPLLNCDDPRQKLTSLLTERENHYYLSHLRIDTNGKTAQEVATEIIEAL
jgi:shikimate kinase